MVGSCAMGAEARSKVLQDGRSLSLRRCFHLSTASEHWKSAGCCVAIANFDENILFVRWIPSLVNAGPKTKRKQMLAALPSYSLHAHLCLILFSTSCYLLIAYRGCLPSQRPATDLKHGFRFECVSSSQNAAHP